MNRSTLLKLRQLKVIIIAWVIVSLFIAVYDHLVLHSNDSLGTSDLYTFKVSIITNLVSSLLAGVIGGSILVFYINVKYQDSPYGNIILAVTLFFIVVTELITLILALIVVPLKTGLSFSDETFWSAYRAFLFDTARAKAAIAWAFIVAVTQLLLQVNSKFGQANFWNIIHGRYNSPQVEKRIFMFLDINSSTTIAEELGDEKYHSFLKDFFADITDPILENRGNIYQYVGDEVVIAWNYDDGKQNLHCLRCFYDMKRQIKKRQKKYLDRYGLVPSFKAGIHCGRVIAGEIGIVKRDITYSGNVLNTTSRILNKCEEFGEELIASAELLSELGPVTKYVAKPLGAIKLRGQEREVMLNAMRLSG